MAVAGTASSDSGDSIEIIPMMANSLTDARLVGLLLGQQWPFIRPIASVRNDRFESVSFSVRPSVCRSVYLPLLYLATVVCS